MFNMFKWLFGGCRKGEVRYCRYSDDLYPIEYLLMDSFRISGSDRFWICSRIGEGDLKKRPVIPEFMLFKTLQEAYKHYDSQIVKGKSPKRMWLLFS